MNEETKDELISLLKAERAAIIKGLEMIATGNCGDANKWCGKFLVSMGHWNEEDYIMARTK